MSPIYDRSNITKLMSPNVTSIPIWHHFAKLRKVFASKFVKNISNSQTTHKGWQMKLVRIGFGTFRYCIQYVPICLHANSTKSLTGNENWSMPKVNIRKLKFFQGYSKIRKNIFSWTIIYQILKKKNQKFRLSMSQIHKRLNSLCYFF